VSRSKVLVLVDRVVRPGRPRCQSCGTVLSRQEAEQTWRKWSANHERWINVPYHYCRDCD
jgi:hypothetical protein